MTLRTERVASLLKEELGTFITREFRDPAYGLITVTDVQVSPDLRIAKVYVSVMGTEEVKADTMRMLELRRGELRAFVGSHMRLKFTPSLHLYLDETQERADRIERLLRQIHKEEGRKRQEGP